MLLIVRGVVDPAVPPVCWNQTPLTFLSFTPPSSLRCEQTQDGRGCTTIGVCGKTPETAALQDLLVDTAKSLSQTALVARNAGVDTSAADGAVMDALFSTLTNVNFSADRIGEYVHDLDGHRKALATAAGAGAGVPAATEPASDLAGMQAQGRSVGLAARGDPFSGSDTILGLQELVTYGVKGLAAYAAHAKAGGKTSPEIAQHIHEALAYIAKPAADQTVDELLGLALKTGEVNVSAMGLLNDMHKETLGTPQPTKVRTTGVAGKAVCVSGHDLLDLQAMLEATEGTGVNVYTHGEMLPGHAYPELAKHKHLVANWGGAWQVQKLDFATFPGPVLMTSNCIVEPTSAYRDRIYTTNAVGFDGVRHVTRDDYKDIVKQALECDGFAADERPKHTMTGFGHDAVLAAAGPILEAVGDGRIKNFYVVGGCDGSEAERSYFRKLARGVGQDEVVMTLGCAKYRFNKVCGWAAVGAVVPSCGSHVCLGQLFDKFGNVEGTEIPRLLDVGQCNDGEHGWHVL